MIIKKLIVLLILSDIQLAATLMHSAKQRYEKLSFWHSKAKTKDPSKAEKSTIISYEAWITALNSYITMQQRALECAPWLGAKIDSRLLQDGDSMQPFVLKYQTDTNSRLYIWGDLHGDIQALTTSLYKLYKEGVINDNFTFSHAKTLFLFLGDIVDRGMHGIDTLALLWILSLKNPGRVIITRGNHEDIHLTQQYGFMQQLADFYQRNRNAVQQSIYINKPMTIYNSFFGIHKRLKMSPDNNELKKIVSKITVFFNILPAAAFVGCNNSFIQCCHGGLEPRYNPIELLMNKHDVCFENIVLLKLPETISLHKAHYDIAQAPKRYFLGQLMTDSWTDTVVGSLSPQQLGFLWNDFNVINPLITIYDSNRGLMLGKTFTKKLLEMYSNGSVSVKGIIRAHQHNNSMPGIFDHANIGVYALWETPALVFTTIATSIYTKAAAFIELHLDDRFDYWQLISHNLQHDCWHSRKELYSNWHNIVV